MRLNEEYMNDIKKIDKMLKNNHRNDIETQKILSYREILVLSYGAKIMEKCNHSICNNYGYYKTRGKDICETSREEADFRLVVCQECGESIYLVKTDYSNWDSRIENETIEVRQKQYCKKM